MKTYSGCRDANGCRIWIDGKWQLLPGPSQKIANHSPDGFEWGYCGSGPAQTALAILLDYCQDADRTLRAMSLYQSFKRHVVCQMPREWELTGSEIDMWLTNEDEAGSIRYFKAKWDGARSEGLEPK